MVTAGDRGHQELEGAGSSPPRARREPGPADIYLDIRLPASRAGEDEFLLFYVVLGNLLRLHKHYHGPHVCPQRPTVQGGNGDTGRKVPCLGKPTVWSLSVAPRPTPRGHV